MVAKKADKLKDQYNSIKATFLVRLKSRGLVEQVFIRMPIACQKVKLESNQSFLYKNP